MFGEFEEISNLRIPFGFMFPEGPKLHPGGGFNFTVKRKYESILQKHFDKKIKKYNYFYTKTNQFQK